MRANEGGFDPPLRETGYYKTVHDLVEAMYREVQIVLDGRDTSGRLSLMGILLNGFVVPQCEALKREDPDDQIVRRFEQDWERIGSEYNRSNFGFDLRFSSTNEVMERLRVISIFLREVGVTQIQERGQHWEDTELEFMEDQLK